MVASNHAHLLLFVENMHLFSMVLLGSWKCITTVSCMCSTCLQVALRAMQKRLNSSSTAEGAPHLAEVGRLKGALRQADTEYRKLLEQGRRQERTASTKDSVMGCAQLQASNKALKQDLADSQQQAKQARQHLQQSQEQLQRYVQETEKLQQLVKKLSEAVAGMHGAVEKADGLGQKQGSMGTHIHNNLQAVHDAVQRNLSRYESESPECRFSSSDILLPALWKAPRAQRERHIAPTGFQ